MTETYKLEEEGEYIPYCIGSIRHDGVVSTSNRLIRPIELSANEYKALLYAMAAANQTEKNNGSGEITEQTYIYLKGETQEELEDIAAEAAYENAIEWSSFEELEDYGYSPEDYYDECGYRIREITEKEYYEYGGE